MPKGAESCVILAATAEFITNPVVIWMRLQNTIVMTDICELADVTPTRFLGLVVRPLGETSKATELGKVMGTLMSDQVLSLIYSKYCIFHLGYKILWPKYLNTINLNIP